MRLHEIDKTIYFKEEFLDHFRRILSTNEPWVIPDIYQHMDQMYVPDGLDRQILLALLPDLVKWFERCTQKADEPGNQLVHLIDGMLLVKEHRLSEFIPHMVSILDDNKHVVIRKLLGMMKEMEASDMHDILKIFNQLGITWPELAIINKSNKVELNRWAAQYPHA